MKKIYLLMVFQTFLITLIQKAYSQITFQLKANKTYFKQVQQTANKDILLTSGNTVNELIISRLSSDGKEKWSKKYSYKSFLNNAVITATKDNGFIFSDLYIDSNQLITFSVTKCNESGNIIWSKAYNTGDKNSFTNFQGPLTWETPSGNLYVVVDKRNNYFQVTKLSDKGTVTWCKHYTQEIYSGEFTNSIVSGEDDGLLVSRSVINCEGYCTTGKLQKIDKNGNTVFPGFLMDQYIAPILSWHTITKKLLEL